jgi:uncharacterized protein
MAGQIVHVEIPAGNTEAARAFWGGLFGWEFQAFEGSPTEYHLFRISDNSGGAIMEADGAKRGMRPYFDVADVNAGIAKVRELGGESSDAMPVPNMGWFATCTDVEGNEFGLWQNDESASM